MDAKSKVDFINSVGSGSNIPCHICGTSNKSDSRFCIACGAEIVVPAKPQNSAPVSENATEASVHAKAVKYVEPGNVFAQGLPDWNIEPPQVMVRRH